jgi:hypothetical protein
VEGRGPHAPLLEPGITEGRTNNVKELLNGFLAFVCLASAAPFNRAGGSISGIWTTAVTDLTTANAAAAS